VNLPVVWSPAAKEEYAELLAFIESHFGTDAALAMLDKTDAVVEIITAFPMAYPASSMRPDIRKAVISEQTSLLYRISDTQVQLLHFWDNRQNPDLLENL
jgi:plasmid stabilization system protein ParE